MLLKFQNPFPHNLSAMWRGAFPLLELLLRLLFGLGGRLPLSPRSAWRQLGACVEVRMCAKPQRLRPGRIRKRWTASALSNHWKLFFVLLGTFTESFSRLALCCPSCSCIGGASLESSCFFT